MKIIDVIITTIPDLLMVQAGDCSLDNHVRPLRGRYSVNPFSAKPQTAVANAPLVWGYGRLCLAEALTLNQRIIFNRTGRNFLI